MGNQATRSTVVTVPFHRSNSTRPDLKNPDGARFCGRFSKSIQDSPRISTRRSTARALSARSGIASKPIAPRLRRPPPGVKGQRGEGWRPEARPKPLRRRFLALLACHPRATLPDPASARLRPSGALCPPSPRRPLLPPLGGRAESAASGTGGVAVRCLHGDVYYGIVV